MALAATIDVKGLAMNYAVAWFFLMAVLALMMLLNGP
jgi:hypothetical protein